MPGNVVDSSTTSWPLAITPASVRAAPSSGPRSGSRLRFSGVGTQIRIASAPCRSTARVVNSIRSSTGGQLIGRDVLDVRDAGAESLDLARVHVDADDLLARLRERDGQGQPDVAEADDSDAHPDTVPSPK